MIQLYKEYDRIHVAMLSRLLYETFSTFIYQWLFKIKELAIQVMHGIKHDVLFILNTDRQKSDGEKLQNLIER